jgi:hypothetical protein
MTAFVTVLVEEKNDVWKAENSVFLIRSYKNIVPENEQVMDGKVTPANTLLILRDNKVVLIPYRKGLGTSTETEIIADGLEKSDLIITGKVGASSGGANQGAVRMPGMGNPMGGGGRR